MSKGTRIPASAWPRWAAHAGSVVWIWWAIMAEAGGSISSVATKGVFPSTQLEVDYTPGQISRKQAPARNSPLLLPIATRAGRPADAEEVSRFGVSRPFPPTLFALLPGSLSSPALGGAVPLSWFLRPSQSAGTFQHSYTRSFISSAKGNRPVVLPEIRLGLAERHEYLHRLIAGMLQLAADRVNPAGVSRQSGTNI